MPIRITGLNSGLDTEAIISALVSSYNYKTNKYKKAQTKLSWKQDAWKTLNTKIYSLYSSVGNLKLSSAYNLKSTTVSDTTKATVTASNSAPSGTQSLNIISVAQAGYLTGGQLDSSVSTSTTLAELGYTGGDGKINLTKGDGTTTSIEVTQGTTVGSFIASLKDALSDTEVEKWEQKIKDSLLRRDESLEKIMSTMTNSMSKGYEVNGKTYYLSNFGIKTLGYFNAPETQEYAYHIDGDSDDTATSGNDDKLMAMINSDPDTVVSFMQQLTSDLYTAIGDKMKSSTLSSSYKVYNDKEMASEYSDYTDLIKKWEEKLQDKEDYYYNKFSAMETALSKLNSQTSSLSNLFGN